MNLLPTGFDFADKYRPEDLLFFMEASNPLPQPKSNWGRPNGICFMGIVEQEKNARQSYIKTVYNDELYNYVQQDSDVWFVGIYIDSMITLLREYKMI
jgi:hypothetical protein